MHFALIANSVLLNFFAGIIRQSELLLKHALPDFKYVHQVTQGHVRIDCGLMLGKHYVSSVDGKGNVVFLRLVKNFFDGVDVDFGIRRVVCIKYCVV